MSDKAIRAAKLTAAGILEKARARVAVDRAGGQIAPSKYLPDVPRQVHAAGGYVPTSFAQPPQQLVVARVARPVQQQQGPSTMDSLTQLAELAYGKPPEAKVESPSAATEGHSPEAVAAGMSSRAQEAMNALRKGWTGQAFDIESAYRDPNQNQAVGGAKGSQHLHGNAYDIDTTGWTPEQKLALATEAYNAGFRGFGFYGNNLHFDVGAQRAWGPSYHRESIPDWAQPWTQQYLGYASGGKVDMFEGIHPDLQDEQGNPKDLWHGTPSEPFDEFKDAKLGERDAGFYGRGHYLTPDRENAEEYTADEHGEPGNVMGPLHAALKNPYVWDASEQGAHRTLRDLQTMGIMKGQDKLEPWDNLQSHHIRPFMDEMKRRGHDGVIMKTGRGVQEIVVFKPSAIKHRDAERFDPNDPNIYHARGGVAK